ncbi:sensor histidine kinase [Rheinheimera sp. 4Y26]|uniref:sensor histidine kinase n=1 Tax=Rheinheimera sp. 4Y26 TaxID=2977811 RepID=UPI0021B133BB|nr:histidine kinase [Rheinheimera sp. 4Y26]MCT6700393.1 histidine kinase [Rheinheimera sp. 4Y26]
MKRLAPLKPGDVFALLPVLLAWLLAALRPAMTLEQTDWLLLWPQAGWLLLQFFPLLLAQAAAQFFARRFIEGQQQGGQPQPASLTFKMTLLLLFWLVVMLGYPAALNILSLEQRVLAFGFSLLYWLHFCYQHKLQHARRWQWLWSLDGVLALLLLCWTVGWALLLVSHAPGLAQQPIPVQFDWQRILQNPLLTLYYLWQFSVLAALMYGCYWFNRYWLVRRILARHGLLPFVMLSLVLMLLSYVPLALLLLQLPMNQVAVPAVPAGSHNPFDWYNFNFMLLQWLFTTPLILAFDRQQQETNLAQIQHQKIQTELQLLQQQINPHFLFNTLNNLYALCLIKSDDAPKLILQLADLLRYVVYQGQQNLVTLQQELDYLQHYLTLQQLRVSNKTSLKLQLPQNASQHQLPPLLLIMLVENAYKHGVEPSADACQVEIIVSIKQQRLYFSCVNSYEHKGGHAGAVGSNTTTGLGLENLRRRLQLYYGDNFYLSSAAQHHSTKQLSWLAELELPLEFSTGATDAEIAAG